MMANPQPAATAATPPDDVIDRRLNLKIPSFSGKENRGAVATFILEAQTAITAAGLLNRPIEAAGYFAHALKKTGFRMVRYTNGHTTHHTRQL